MQSLKVYYDHFCRKTKVLVMIENFTLNFIVQMKSMILLFHFLMLRIMKHENACYCCFIACHNNTGMLL
jgi:hypothetical protein